MIDIKKRFIAGAVCPKCSATDTLVMYQSDGHDYRECVECGFHERLVFKQQMNELETRVNKTEEQKQSETQIIRFIEPKSDQSPSR